jgi:uncharacterized protein (TIGR00730 family)
MNMDSICVFCGAQDAVPQEHLDVATELGNAMASAKKTLVYGGGDCGLMGRTANAVMDSGGEVIGVFPRHMRALEKEHVGLTEIHMVDTMHERKQMMYDKSDAFLILPGGCGTMDEFFEILTWRQICLHEKPIMIFNHLGCWDHLIGLLDNIIKNGFAREETRESFEVLPDFAALKARCGL